MNSNAASYKKAAIMSASPERLILMLYDGALDAMRRAKAGFQLEDIKARNEMISNNLIKAQNIFGELQRSLRMDKKSEFSDQMYGLYDFYVMKLNEANFKKVEEPVDVVIDLFTDIRNAWSEMLSQQTLRAEVVKPANGAGVGGEISLRA
ncbi:MAG: flagellar export chaperone FliS [Opitutales bacterium TMED158]|nr:MAG: flagellar export chaperone FliS [Opitutales bacterium TMED158]